jgi:Flp pilus assembly protein TadD
VPALAAVSPSEARKADVGSTAPDVPAASLKLETASLLGEDGSEATAPTCDELLAGASPDRKHTWSDHFRAARGALIRGDLDASQRAFCRATGAVSAPATVSLELAQLLLLRRDAIAANTWIEQAAQLAPESTRILELKGDTAVRIGNLEEARSAWLRAAGLSPDDGAGIDRMLRRVLADADASLRARDPRRAERLLRRVLAFRPDDAAAHTKLGIALTRLGFPDSAELWFRRSAQLDG